MEYSAQASGFNVSNLISDPRMMKYFGKYDIDGHKIWFRHSQCSENKG